MVSAKLEGLTISVVPGTGQMGRALVEKLAAAGLPIIVGSRTAAKAEAVAAEVSAKINKNVKGLPLAEAAAAGDVIIWAISAIVEVTNACEQEDTIHDERESTTSMQKLEDLWMSYERISRLMQVYERPECMKVDGVSLCMDGLHVGVGYVVLSEREEVLKSLAKHLEGKVIIDVTNMLLEEKDWGQVSTVLWSQKALGVPARWTAAWKATFYKIVENPPPASHPSGVLVPGDDEGAVDITVALVESIPGFKAIRAGPLKNSKITELFGPMWMVLLDQLNAGGNWRSSFSYFDHDAQN